MDRIHELMMDAPNEIVEAWLKQCNNIYLGGCEYTRLKHRYPDYIDDRGFVTLIKQG